MQASLTFYIGVPFEILVFVTDFSFSSRIFSEFLSCHQTFFSFNGLREKTCKTLWKKLKDFFSHNASCLLFTKEFNSSFNYRYVSFFMPLSLFIQKIRVCIWKKSNCLFNSLIDNKITNWLNSKHSQTAI